MIGTPPTGTPPTGTPPTGTPPTGTPPTGTPPTGTPPTGTPPAGTPRTVAEALRFGTARLAAAGIENGRREARLLLAHALGVTQEALIRDPSAAADTATFDRLIARRAAREPISYILGWREFWSLRFRVSSATLIPRPDSETVVATALALFPGRDAAPRVLDLGTGTGCLLLAFLHERPHAFGVGIDIAEAAAQLAARNARDLGLSSRSAFVRGDWASAIAGRFDLVLSNPPYVTRSDLAGLMPEVAGHEPRAALDGGPDGLSAYRSIVATLPGLLAAGGRAVLELGLGQFAAVAGFARTVGLSAEARRDLGGIDRALILG